MHELSRRRLAPLSGVALIAALVAALCGSVATAATAQAQTTSPPATPLVADNVIFDPVAEGYDDNLERLQVDSDGTVAVAVVQKNNKYQVIKVDLASGAITKPGRLTASEPRIVLSDNGATLIIQYLNEDAAVPTTTNVVNLGNGSTTRLAYNGFIHALSKNGQLGSGLIYDDATEQLVAVVVDTFTGVVNNLPALGGIRGTLTNTSMSGDGNVVAAYSSAGHLSTIDLGATPARWTKHGQTHSAITRLDGEKFWNTSVALSYSGQIVAYQGSRPTVKNLDTTKRTVVPAPVASVIGYAIDISADGRLVAFDTRSPISPFDSDDENFDDFTGALGTNDAYVWNPSNQVVTWASLRHDLDSVGGGGRAANLIGGALDELVYTGQASAAGKGSTTENAILHSRPLERSDATCGGTPATVLLILGETPTSGNDVIKGTAANDVINAGSGDDIICGASGDDLINGGTGNDIIFDGPDDDTVNAGPGNDVINGYSLYYFRNTCSQAETYNGGDGNDVIVAVARNPHVEELAGCPALRPLRVDGGSGVDTLSVIGGPFKITGGPGNDKLTGFSTVAGEINGGPGRDVITGATKANGGTGNDTITGTKGTDLLIGGKGSDTIDGGKGDDVINGGGGNDTIKAGGGADAVKGGKGRDTIDGGPGADSCIDTKNTKFTKCEVQKRR